MEVRTLTSNELKDYSKLATQVISSNPYYNDAAKMGEIEKFSENSLEQKIKDENNLFVFAQENGSLIGFFNGKYDSGTFWANWLGVDSNYRNQGVTKHILFYVEQKLRQTNVHKVWFDTLMENKEAINLVETMGFVKVANLYNHWHKQDFYLWEKEL